MSGVRPEGPGYTREARAHTRSDQPHKAPADDAATQRHPYAGHPAAAVLADHQPVYVTATTQPAAKIRCCCRAWEGAWCDLPAHQTEALDQAGLLK